MIELPRPLADAMVEHARASAPREACGVLAGRPGSAARVYVMRNVEPGVARFRFDGGEQRRVLRHAAASGLELLGYFHSHPRTAAVPSAEDTAAAHRRDPWSREPVPAHPGALHLIVSLRDGDPEIRAFRYERGRAVEGGVRIS